MPRLLRDVKMLHMWIQITKGYPRFKLIFVDRTMDGALPHLEEDGEINPGFHRLFRYEGERLTTTTTTSGN